MQREIVLVLGKTGHGKTQWARHYLRKVSRLFLYDAMREYPIPWLSHEQIIELYDSGRLNHPAAFRIGSNDRDSVELLGAIAFLSTQCTLLMEEASLVFARGERISGWAADIVFLGRHRAVSLLVTAQRPISIPVDLRSQASRVVSFAQHEGQDVLWLREFFGQRVKELPNLPELECLDASADGISRYKIPIASPSAALPAAAPLGTRRALDETK